MGEDLDDDAAAKKEQQLPKTNRTYGEQDYWEQRFQSEEEYEWLLSWNQLSHQLLPYLETKSRILVVGCGNSPFSGDMYKAGYRNIVNLDYAASVIERMKLKYADDWSEMKWVVGDMTDMTFDDESFDVVIDKAAMDSMLTQEGDVWNPNETMVKAARCMCRHVSRVLKRGGGVFLQVSLTQPHFRKKYLLGWHTTGVETDANTTLMRDDYSTEFQWTFRYEPAGTEEDRKAAFGHFLYVMTATKQSAPKLL